MNENIANLEVIEKIEKNDKSENNSISFTTITAFILGYITVCGALWHIGYWSTFDFNYLSYVSFSDLFKSAVQPFLSNLFIWMNVLIIIVSWGLTTLFCFIVNLFSKKKKIDLFNLPSTGNPFIPNQIGYLLMGLCFLSLATFLFSTFSRYFLSLLTWTGGFGFVLLFYYSGVLKKYLKTDYSRFLIISISIFFAFFNFTNAKNQSLAIRYKYQYNEISNIKLSDTSMNKLFLNKPLLGACDKYTFLLDTNNIVMILSNEEIKTISTVPVINDENYKIWYNSNLRALPKYIKPSPVASPTN